MTTNTELIARLRAGTGGGKHWMTLHTEAASAIEALESQLKNASVSAIAEAAEVDRMKAEVERLTTLAHGQHIELYNARLQLAAAQGQNRWPTYEQVCAWAEQCRDVNVRVHGPWLDPEKLCKLAAEWAAAPIPQQPEPSVPLESSDAASEAIDAMLKEYNYPANPKNAARAGWRACRRLATLPQQPASLLALLTTRSILIQLYEKLGGVIKSSTPISREIEPWPRVSITEESLCDLRKIWESLPEMQEDLMRHVEATPQPKETK